MKIFKNIILFIYKKTIDNAIDQSKDDRDYIDGINNRLKNITENSWTIFKNRQKEFLIEPFAHFLTGLIFLPIAIIYNLYVVIYNTYRFIKYPYAKICNKIIYEEFKKRTNNAKR